MFIVVAQIIPTRDDTINARIQPYNAAIPAVLQSRIDAGKHLRLIDMFTVIASDGNYKTTLLQDNWHPTSSGYALLGAAWYQALSDVL